MLSETQTLLERLAAADRERQKEAGGIFLLRCVKFACAFVLLAFVLDVIVHLNSGWRLAILLALLVGVLALGGLGWYLAMVRRNRAEHIARFIETRDPALGSSLINILQLSEQSSDASLTPLTRDLARQAVENYSASIRNVPLERLARTEALQHHVKRAAIALLIFTVILATVFRISALEIARFVDPFGDHPPYSFTHLAITEPGPVGTNVLYDKGLVLRVKATGHQPREVFLTAYPVGHRDQAITLPMFEKNGGGYDQLLDNVRTEMLAFAHTRDHSSESKQVHIGVTMTPQVEKVLVRTTPPAYTGIKSEETAYAFKSIQALEGTELKFRLQSNRPLREGTLELTAGDQPARKLTLKRSAEKEVTGSFVATDSGRMRFTITDIDGHPSQAECEGGLTVTHDLPPEVHLASPDSDSFVAMDFKLQAQIEAGDDYGLRAVRFYRALNGVYSAPKVFSYTNIIRDSRETTDFDFASLGVQPGDIISLFAEAIDTAPQPHLARSQTVRLAVIGVEDYNNFLREQSDIADAAAKYAELNDDLQTLIEQQKQLGEEIQKLQKAAAGADEKKRTALAQQLDNLVARQNELNRKLERQAERMENFVRQNPLYDVETALQEELRQQAGAIRESTKTNDNATLDVAQRSSPPSGGRQLTPEVLNDFKKASDEQLARLGGVHEQNEQQVEKRFEDLDQMQELVNDFNLFESLYHTQQELAEQSKPYNRPGQLSREDQLALKDLAAREKKVSDALGELREKLGVDAQAAEKLFPKAAQSGRHLAAKIDDNRLKSLAEHAAGQMLSGNGEQSFGLAERLRGEMEKMFGECQNGNCPNSGELDNYLKLQKMNPGNTFAQMSRSRKFGRGHGNQPGQGEGSEGSSGYAMANGSNPKMLGNEQSLHNDAKGSRQSNRLGKGVGSATADANKGQAGETDSIKGLNPVNRQSASVSSESVIEEYNDVVENYFKTITTRKEPANEKQK
jgi:hypothetical protein